MSANIITKWDLGVESHPCLDVVVVLADQRGAFILMSIRCAVRYGS
jgi:hypothetical protein